jgi:RNA polymerase sigma factor (sigma-70 family)
MSVSEYEPEFVSDPDNAHDPHSGADLDAGADLEVDLDADAEAPTDPVRTYLNAIGRTPLLTAAEEVELAKRIEAGLYAERRLAQEAAGEPVPPELADQLRVIAADGHEAKAHMLRANLRLVVSIAKRYARRGLPFLDIIQEGNLGLIRAVEKFDYTKGFKFSTYATWWVRQAIGRGLAEQGRTVRLPVHVNEVLSKLARAERELSQQGRAATDEELAEYLGVSPEKVSELRRVRRDPVSLDLPVGDDADTRLGDLVFDDQGYSAPDLVERHDLTNQLDAVLATLPPREARILRLRFGLTDGRPRKLEEIGAELGLTRERVRQLEKAALAELRRPGHCDALLDWAS